MHILIIAAHGSRRSQSNQEIQQLAHTLNERLAHKYNGVSHAFLEFAPPTIENAMQAAFEQGAEQITVLPYFIAGGKHVGKDIPQAIASVLEQWPDKDIILKEHIGAHKGMLDLLESVC